jgi:hypothetical protein
MTALAAVDPAGPDDDAFCDALAGLCRLCRQLALIAGDAATPGAPLDLDIASEIADSEPDELLDAVLGLVSLHTTADLLLAALGDALADDAPPGTPGTHDAPEPPAWSRELLR